MRLNGRYGIVLDPIANSEAILTQEEKDGGVCLIDFGAGVTSYSVFQEEVLFVVVLFQWVVMILPKRMRVLLIPLLKRRKD